jgi:outer membrane protein insertion porin family
MQRPLAKLLIFALFGAPLFSQSAPDHFPYAFSNFPWWTDSDLRAELKRRIPTLGDELTRNSPVESKIRTSLIAMLKTKGIEAEVQVREPDLDYASHKRVPEAPPVAIVFSVASPPFIQIGDINLDEAPAATSDALNKELEARRGSAYSTQTFWSIEDLIQTSLQARGYLTAKATVEPGTPAKDGDDFKVPITAHIAAGPQYHVLSVKASGGPLFANRDLSSFYTLKPGDTAVPNPFGRLAGVIRSTYWHAGFPDVEIHGEPVLDAEHALATYDLTVTPGPLYHLRSLKILHLDDAQTSTVKAILDMKPGDIYDGTATTTLSRKIAGPSSPLAGYNFSYTPKEDKASQVVDLTLDFFPTK